MPLTRFGPHLHVINNFWLADSFGASAPQIGNAVRWTRERD